MIEIEEQNPEIGPEAIVVPSGESFHLIDKRLLGFVDMGSSETNLNDPMEKEQLDERLHQLAMLARQSREIIESQGGRFNGLVTVLASRENPNWRGSRDLYEETYALASRESPPHT